MDSSPLFNAMEVTTNTTPHGSVGAPVETEPQFVDNHSPKETKSAADVSEVGTPDLHNQQLHEQQVSHEQLKPEQFRYEFSIKVDQTAPQFCIIYDTSIASAVERMICEEQTMPIVQNVVTGVWFFEHKEIKYAIKVDPIAPSASFTCGAETETSVVRTTKIKPKVASILEGLI